MPKMSSTLGVIFYARLGIFSLGQLEELQDVNSFIFHDTLKQSTFTWGKSIVLQNAHIGLTFFSIQREFLKKSIFAWSAGCYSKILKISEEAVFMQLPSSLIYALAPLSSATLGLSSKRYFLKMTKAGDAWHIFWSPKVRGIAMNPVDHPHGGWTNKGGHPKTPTGFLTKGVKTRKKKLWSYKKIFLPKAKLIV